MLTRIDLRGISDAARVTRLPRAQLDVESAADAVRGVVVAVREHGAAAVKAASARFDGVTPSRLRVDGAVIAAAGAA
ncbi:MAG TPA: histidinol dehydrogenase, partial [Micromonosporaceae bacterium]